MCLESTAVKVRQWQSCTGYPAEEQGKYRIHEVFRECATATLLAMAQVIEICCCVRCCPSRGNGEPGVESFPLITGSISYRFSLQVKPYCTTCVTDSAQCLERPLTSTLRSKFPDPPPAFAPQGLTTFSFFSRPSPFSFPFFPSLFFPLELFCLAFRSCRQFEGRHSCSRLFS